MADDLKLKLRIDADADAAAAGVDGVSDSVERLNDTASQGTPDATGELRDGARESADAVDGATAAVDQYADGLTQAARDAGIFRDSQGRLREATGQYASEARKAELGLDGMGDAAKRAGQDLDGAGRSITDMLAAAAGLTAIAAYLKSGIDTSADYETRMLTLEAAIKATGGAAGISAEEIREFSQSLALDTLTDTASVERAATQLLTFKSVAGDAFTQTLTLAQDLAQAGFGTIESNAVQLGKAMEDPVLGLQALRRSGVTFTQDQQDVIKALVATGDTAQAQALILEAVAGQVGGVGKAAAAGLAGSFDTLSQRFEELRLATGDAIAPALIETLNAASKAVEYITENLDNLALAAGGAALIGAMRKLQASTLSVTGALKAGAGAAASFARALGPVGIAAASIALAPLAKDAAEFAASFSEAATRLDEFRQKREAQVQSELNLINQQIEARGRGLEFDRQSRAALLASGEQAIQQYQQEAQAAEQQLLLQQSALLRERELAELRGQSTAEQTAQLEQVLAKLEEVRGAQEAIPFALELVKSGYEEVVLSAAKAQEASLAASQAVTDQLASIEDLTAAESGALVDLGAQAETALAAARAEIEALEQAFPSLAGASREVTDQWLADFSAAEERLNAMTTAADTLRNEGLRRLGLDATEIATGLSADFREAADAMELVAQSTGATTLEIEAALRALADLADTPQEVRAVETAMGGLEDVSQDTADAIRQVADEVLGIADSTSELERAFKTLRVESSAELRKVAAEARAAYDVIRSSSETTMRDQQEAWRAWAEAAIESGDRAAIATAKAEGEALGLRDALVEVGLAADDAGTRGERSGDRIADSYDRAADSARDMRDAQREAADEAEDSARRSERASRAAAEAEEARVTQIVDDARRVMSAREALVARLNAEAAEGGGAGIGARSGGEVEATAGDRGGAGLVAVADIAGAVEDGLSRQHRETITALERLRADVQPRQPEDAESRVDAGRVTRSVEAGAEAGTRRGAGDLAVVMERLTVAVTALSSLLGSGGGAGLVTVQTIRIETPSGVVTTLNDGSASVLVAEMERQAAAMGR